MSLMPINYDPLESSTFVVFPENFNLRNYLKLRFITMSTFYVLSKKKKCHMSIMTTNYNHKGKVYFYLLSDKLGNVRNDLKLLKAY